MADKTPVRVVFNSDNVATGMAEFQTGESVPVANGGTGLTSLGSAGQVLRTNAAGSALEFATLEDLADIISVGSTLTAPSNADFNITTAGTGNIVLNDLSISDNTLSTNRSNDDLKINASGTGTVVLENLKIGTSGATVTTILDEDGFGSNSATSLATQQSIKAYVDAQLTAQDLDFQADSGGALAIDLDSESLTFTGGTGIDTSGSSNTVTFAIDSTVATLTGSQTLTNKTLTTPVIAEIDSTADITLDATNDVNIPANVGLTFGDDGEKIEGDGTDLTISGNNINLTATADVNIPSGVGITFATAEKIESDGTDLTITVGSGGDINIGANIGLTFGDDGEKIEGDGTDLTITGNNIKLTAATDVIIPSNVGLHFTDANEKIESDGSKLTITSGGTAFNLPTSDGSAGQALVTDGAGNLSFDTVATTVSDDTLATVKSNKHLGSTARTIDSINATFIDSAFYFLVQNDIVNETISAEMFAVTNNDSASFLGNRRGIESGGGSNVPTLATDVSNGQYRVRATGSSADCRASFYKVAMSSSTTDATRGNTVTSSNTDVDSASESIDTFAHGTYRGAKYFISVDNDSKTEMDVVEALVVHDGSDAYIKSYGHTTSAGDPLITLTAAISGSNVVVSAAGLETNLNITMHKILLKDNMTASSNANQKAFAAVTVSSTATAIDLMDIDDANGAVYFIVGANSSEGAYSIQEVYTAASPGVPAVANGPFVSTKGTTQLEFTAGFDTSSENSLELFASSTSGGSTSVSGYRISALAG